MVLAKITDHGLLTDQTVRDRDIDGGFCCSPSEQAGKTYSEELSSGTLIPFKNIVWVERALNESMEITYVEQQDSHFKVRTIVADVTGSQRSNEPGSKCSVSQLMALAYANSEPKKSVIVFVNPHSGKGKAIHLYKHYVKPVLSAARYHVELVKTEYSGHATEYMKYVDIDKYDGVICASGDGIPHEVLNGIYSREDRVKAFQKLFIAQTPCGSGNAMALSCLGTLKPGLATLEIIKGHTVRSDLMLVCSKSSSPRISFLSQTYGIIAEADIGTEWMRFIGKIRFDIGVLINILRRKQFPCRVAVKRITSDKKELSEHYKSQYQQHGVTKPLDEDALKPKYFDGQLFDDDRLPAGWEWLDDNVTQNLSIFYTGKLPYIAKDVDFFPAALPNDGAIDLVLFDGRAQVWRSAHSLLQLDKGLHVWHDHVDHLKVESLKLVPMLEKGRTSYISVDGENFPVETIQVEVLPGVMKTVMNDGRYTDSGFLAHIG
ncbi:hypothetical protein KL935_003712 [Ogataea polymorpha]|uniref:DAGKc domain-containing protein n=2 Tax=Ogataea polymorpha TaxID=460523 RepID=A0A9P8SZN9_9ASCO|nr:hypothetical protein KL937_003496 [Ogataea polymorpha]KAG7887948.1 hypothetical protein KL936_003966 [Ogataea polymorpha]KAG7899402.1 hypothetical protein KL935_003712 [Ogataea polymorpha]KAG7907606.1 hypothetical protein KL906_003687 [Ogataea polymorpha]KAG7915537.1 hypothetical protein KL927_003813 [Ogataea polymorpha]